jgi:hypothetical protein
VAVGNVEASFDVLFVGQVEKKSYAIAKWKSCDSGFIFGTTVAKY